MLLPLPLPLRRHAAFVFFAAYHVVCRRRFFFISMPPCRYVFSPAMPLYAFHMMLFLPRRCFSYFYAAKTYACRALDSDSVIFASYKRYCRRFAACFHAYFALFRFTLLWLFTPRAVTPATSCLMLLRHDSRYEFSPMPIAIAIYYAATPRHIRDADISPPLD